MGRASLASLPFDLQGDFLCMCDWGSLLAWRRRNIGSGEDPTSSLNCSAILVLSFVHREWISSYFTLGAHPLLASLWYWSPSTVESFLTPNSVRTGDTTVSTENWKIAWFEKQHSLVSEVKGRIKKTGGSPIYLPWLLVLKMLSSLSLLLRSLMLVLW